LWSWYDMRRIFWCIPKNWRLASMSDA